MKFDFAIFRNLKKELKLISGYVLCLFKEAESAGKI